jgi:hypothetical protein
MNEAINNARVEGLQAELDRLHSDSNRINKAIQDIESELTFIKLGAKYPVGSEVEFRNHRYRITGYTKMYVKGVMIKKDGTEGAEKDLWGLI